MRMHKKVQNATENKITINSTITDSNITPLENDGHRGTLYKRDRYTTRENMGLP